MNERTKWNGKKFVSSVDTESNESSRWSLMSNWENILIDGRISLHHCFINFKYASFTLIYLFFFSDFCTFCKCCAILHSLLVYISGFHVIIIGKANENEKMIAMSGRPIGTFMYLSPSSLIGYKRCRYLVQLKNIAIDSAVVQCDAYKWSNGSHADAHCILSSILLQMLWSAKCAYHAAFCI